MHRYAGVSQSKGARRLWAQSLSRFGLLSYSTGMPSTSRTAILEVLLYFLCISFKQLVFFSSESFSARHLNLSLPPLFPCIFSFTDFALVFCCCLFSLPFICRLAVPPNGWKRTLQSCCTGVDWRANVFLKFVLRTFSSSTITRWQKQHWKSCKCPLFSCCPCCILSSQ